MLNAGGQDEEVAGLVSNGSPTNLSLSAACRSQHKPPASYCSCASQSVARVSKSVRSRNHFCVPPPGELTAHRGWSGHSQPPLARHHALRQRPPRKVEMVGLDIGCEDDTHHPGRAGESWSRNEPCSLRSLASLGDALAGSNGTLTVAGRLTLQSSASQCTSNSRPRGISHVNRCRCRNILFRREGCTRETFVFVCGP